MNCSDDHGASPLLLSLRAGNFRLSELLVLNGAAISAVDAQGRGVGHYLSSCLSGDFDKAVRLLGKMGVECFRRGEGGRSLACEACRAYNIPLLKALINHSRNSWEKYAEQLARSGDSKVMGLLKDIGSPDLSHKLGIHRHINGPTQHDTPAKEPPNSLEAEIQGLLRSVEASKKVF